MVGRGMLVQAVCVFVGLRPWDPAVGAFPSLDTTLKLKRFGFVLDLDILIKNTKIRSVLCSPMSGG